MYSRLDHAKAIITAIDGAIDSFETHSRVNTPRLIRQWIVQMGDQMDMLKLVAVSLGTLPDSDKADRIARLVQRSIAHTSLRGFNFGIVYSRLDHANAIITAIDGAIVSFETNSRVNTPRLILQWIAQMGNPMNTLQIMALSFGIMPDSDKVSRIIRLVQRSMANTRLGKFNMKAAVAGFQSSAYFQASFAV